MRFLLIHYLDETAELNPAEDPDAEDSAAAVEMRDWVAEMEGSSVKVLGGALRPSGEATMVRMRGGELLVSDGARRRTGKRLARRGRGWGVPLAARVASSRSLLTWSHGDHRRERSSS